MWFTLPTLSAVVTSWRGKNLCYTQQMSKISSGSYPNSRSQSRRKGSVYVRSLQTTRCDLSKFSPVRGKVVQHIGRIGANAIHAQIVERGNLGWTFFVPCDN